jgi:hypothetical protein
MPDRWVILTAHDRRFGMDNPVCEQIQARKVRARLRAACAAAERNVSQTCRFFGVSRSLYYIWKKRFEQKGWPAFAI